MSDLYYKPGEDDGGLEPPSDDLLAGEYVLGVLDAEQRLVVQARIEAEPAFAQRVAAWEERMGPWAESIEPAEVPPYLWPRIRARLGWTTVELKRSSPSVWQSVGFWRAISGVAVAAAIAAIVIGVMPRPLALQSPHTAAQSSAPVTTLAHDDGTPGWLASVDAVRGTVQLVPVPTPPDTQGRVPQLWLIAPGKSPQSLGLVSNNRSNSVAVPAGLRPALAAGAVLAVSLEPPGGAPHGAPTGPIVAKGMIQL